MRDKVYHERLAQISHDTEQYLIATYRLIELTRETYERGMRSNDEMQRMIAQSRRILKTRQ